MRRRYREPVFIAFTLALIASLSVHLPVYEVLGGLADRFRSQAEEARKANQFNPVEVDFEVPSDDKSQRARRKPAERKTAKREQKPEQVVQAVEAQTKEANQPPPPRPEEARQAVQQHSTNPDVEPPENAQFLAEQNNQVAEETVARIRNMIRDDALPTPDRQQKPSNTLEEQGNSREQEIAEARNKEGSDARKVTEEEASRKRPDKAIKADPIKAERVSRQAPDGKQANTSGDRAGETADETITITDAAGRSAFVDRVAQGKVVENGRRGAARAASWPGRSTKPRSVPTSSKRIAARTSRSASLRKGVSRARRPGTSFEPRSRTMHLA